MMRMLPNIILIMFICLVCDVAYSNDLDGDGVPDAVEDTNGDGVCDELDRDSDNDGYPDCNDPDDDGDGILTLLEGVGDTDGDGIPNYLDLDSDNDGMSDFEETAGGTAIGDNDGDGLEDFVDTDDEDGPLGDSDGDGISNEQEIKIGSNPNDPDSDGDGILDGIEVGDYADSPIDTDGDGISDLLDIDDDGDGISTFEEGAGDFDGDGIPNYLDDDSDGDGKSDQDEGVGDLDGDGAINFLDPDDFDGPIADPDEDGILNWAEKFIIGSNPYSWDSDGDGIGDDDEYLLDSDHDSIPDILDTDDDGDGILTADEGASDTDGDGTPDYLDYDSDGDGINDICEGDDDLDGDGLPNYLDDDSDGDGVLDVEEGAGDKDCDGILDFLDADDMDGPCCVVLPGIGVICAGPEGKFGEMPFERGLGCFTSPWAPDEDTSPPPPKAPLTLVPVIDARTLRIGGEDIQLYGIKVPMGSRLCRAMKKDNCADMAANILREKLGLSLVDCKIIGTTKRGITQGRCTINGEDLSEFMVRQGFAKARKSAERRLKVLEKEAKRFNRGFWNSLR
ncbi:MAG: hypothetical protein GY775_17940 [Candidatus Scalindua sp.]|nr:hypothetical protein [Candidatus Scalindua sp.]